MHASMIWVAGLALPLAACSAETAEQEAAPASNESPAAPAPAPTAPSSPASQENLRDWLVGTWSFLPNCENDFVVIYEADGTMHTDSQIGTWTIEGTVVTETITETFEMGEEGTTPVDPPVIREVTVERIDDTHGALTLAGQTDPILKCSVP